MSHSEKKEKETKPFSATVFIINIFVSVTVYLLFLAIFFPNIWRVQVEASLSSLIMTFILCHLCNAFLEHLFHRYVLHAPVIPGLSYFYKSHTTHHALTRVVYKKIKGVHNVYPIIDEKQYEDSYFPWYSYTVFALVLTGPMALGQWLFTSAPIFLGGTLALAWTISLYEMLHAFEHKPLTKWIPKLENRNPVIRTFWRKVYAFHLRHHADIKCNEGISGFFGIPIADFVFRTWIDPATLYVHGSNVDPKEFSSPKPIFFIRWLDKIVERKVKDRRSKFK